MFQALTNMLAEQNVILKGLHICGEFSAIFCKGDNFCDFLLLPWTSSSFWKGVYYKRKEFAHKGSKQTPFQKGDKHSFDRVAATEMYLFPLGNSYKVLKRSFVTKQEIYCIKLFNSPMLTFTE